MQSVTVEKRSLPWALSEDQKHVYYSSTNYDKFSFDRVNRKLNKYHLAKLLAAVAEKNFLPGYPIVVDPRFNILDGQHRFKTAKSLGLPIYYIVVPDMTMQDVAEANSLNLAWRVKDYMESYSADNLIDYVILKELIEAYPFLTVTNATFLLGGGLSPKAKKEYKEGRFKVTRKEFAYQVAACMEYFNAIPEAYQLRHYLVYTKAVAILVGTPGFNQDRMFRNMAKMRNHISQAVDIQGYLDWMGRIYNFKYTGAKQLTFTQKIKVAAKEPDQA